jgi:hypothetical protein
MSVSLEKRELFVMLDTETVYLKKRAYEVAFSVFDSVTCDIVESHKFYIKETLESAMFYFLRNQKMPIFWPNRLNVIDCLKQSVSWQSAIDSMILVLKKHDVKNIIAHNVAFDVSAIYKTSELYCDESQYNTMFDFVSSMTKLELSGFFVYGLPEGLAYLLPHKAKSGCATFKADYLCPTLLGVSQNHDALSDCANQIQLYKIALANSGIYKHCGTIYGNMKMFHEVQYENARRLGTSELD